MQDDSEQEEDSLSGMPGGSPTTAQRIPEKLVFKSPKFAYRVIETLMFSAGSLVGGILGAYRGAALQQESTVITGFLLVFTAGGFVISFSPSVLSNVRWRQRRCIRLLTLSSNACS